MLYYSLYYRKGIFFTRPSAYPSRGEVNFVLQEPCFGSTAFPKGAVGISKFLAIYLNDHLASATAGVDLARRTLKRNPHGSLGELLRRLVLEMEGQRQALEQLMHENNTPPSNLKIVAVRLAERLGRLKPNGRLFGYSPLSRMVELQGLCLVSHMRLMLWRTLKQVVEADILAGLDPDRLQAQALEHILSIQDELDRAAKLAL
jgi:hypothetical protein